MKQRYRNLKILISDCSFVDEVVDLLHQYIKTYSDLDLDEKTSMIVQMDAINVNYFISNVDREKLHKVINEMDKWHDAWCDISQKRPDIEYFGKKPEIRSMIAMVK